MAVDTAQDASDGGQPPTGSAMACSQGATVLEPVIKCEIGAPSSNKGGYILRNLFLNCMKSKRKQQVSRAINPSRIDERELTLSISFLRDKCESATPPYNLRV